MKSLINLELTPAEAKEACDPCAESAQPRFPWGLSIYLDNDTLTKLGLSQLPAPGDVLALTAKVVVNSVSANESQDASVERTLGLQITDMALEDGRANRDAASILYGAAK